METGQRERRQFAALRTSVQLLVSFSSQPDQNYKTINISHNGILIECPHLKEVNESVTIATQLPPQGQTITMIARVARKLVREGKPCLGIQIIEMTAEDRALWLAYISKIETLTLPDPNQSLTQRILKERLDHGRNKHTLVLRFGTLDSLTNCLHTSITTGTLHIDTPMLKTAGDEVELLFIHPKTDKQLLLNADIVSTESQQQTPGILLQLRKSSEERKKAIQSFLT